MNDLPSEPTLDLPVDSISERRRRIESLTDFKGTNLYGGERCRCSDCGNVHWKKPTNPKVEEASNE